MINAVNIHDVGNPVAVNNGQTVVENSYFHDLSAGAGTHYNGIEYNGGGSADFSLLIQNNTINDNAAIPTDAIMLDNYFGAVNNVTIRNNLLTGGQYTIYVDGRFNSNPITNVSITNNDIGPGVFGNTAFVDNSPVFTGNVDDRPSSCSLAGVPGNLVGFGGCGTYGTGNTITLTLYASERR